MSCKPFICVLQHFQIFVYQTGTTCKWTKWWYK